MSLLDGLNSMMINPLYDSIMEASIDNELDFEFALETVVDKSISLSDDDISAILNDDDPDNQFADMTSRDENINKIIDDEIGGGDLASLEAMLDDFVMENKMDTPEPDDFGDPPEIREKNPKAYEMNEDNFEYDKEDELDDDFYHEEETAASLDSILDSVFKNV